MKTANSVSSNLPPEMQKVPKKEIFSYFCYGTGECISFGLMSSFVLYFYTNILGISAIAASAIFIIARGVDCFIDPIVGSIVDTRHPKRGKFRAYMFFMPAIITVITILCFTKLNISPSFKIIYAGITYILWGMLYSVSDVPFWSMSAVMSENTQERTKLVTFANLGVVVGMSIPTMAFVYIASLVSSSNEGIGYFGATVILCIIGFFLMNIGYRFTKERVKPSTEKIRIRDTIKSIRSNKPMFLVLLAFFCTVFYNVATGLFIYFFTYNMGNAELMSVLGGVSILAAIGFFGVPYLTSKFDKKTIYITLMALDIVVRIIFYFLGYHNLVVVFVILGICALLYSVCGPLSSAMLANTIEYAELKTGKRCEAITFAGQTFTGKMAIAVGGGLTGIVLTIIGYIPNQAQTSWTLSAMFFCIVLIPAIGDILRIIILCFYKFTDKEYKKVLVQLEEKRKLKQAEA
ncbi:MAG: MFS transporter [bacterium]|nr:MFS transporter [bacterium]